MIIKLPSVSKTKSNINFYCNINNHISIKDKKKISKFYYNKELIFEYFFELENDKFIMHIGILSDITNKFYYHIIGAKIYEHSKKFNSSSIIVNSSQVFLDEIIFGIYRKDYIFNKYLSKSNFSNYLHNYKLKNKSQYLLESLTHLKEMVSEPSNIIFPESFAKISTAQIKKSRVKTKILNSSDIKKIGLNCLLAVNQGSNKEPRVVEFVSKNSKKNVDVLFVGKGVCFDSGGISIKPSTGMEDMKWDMAGAAVVSSIMKYLSSLNTKFSYAGIIGLVENMPSGSAYKPGDIIKSYKGINVEVLNTDAEGRLVLADIISYGCDIYKPKLVIDFATLTGAIMVALGQHYAGLYSNDDYVADVLYKSGIETNDKVWRMPLHEEFNEELNSPFVDLKNIGLGRYGGSITAAQFLQRFIPNGIKWAHLDIAGVTWKNSGDILNSKGSTGFGLTLISDFIDKYF